VQSLSDHRSRTPLHRGVRFAPSPTGLFHIGNLRTAWISEHLARHLQQPWIVRFEDIDRPRTVPTAQAQQLADMAAIELIPDEVLIQTSFQSRHWSVFLKGIESGQIYPCNCSRKTVHAALASLASAPHGGVAAIYDGHCRDKKVPQAPGESALAWRFRNKNPDGQDDFIVARTVGFDGDPAQVSALVPSDVDFVPAYHFACAVDDFAGRYQLLVRSADLQPAATLQRAIMGWLKESSGIEDFTVPDIFHTALITQNDGQRLEKRTGGVTLAELGQLGVTRSQLRTLFEKSFDTASALRELQKPRTSLPSSEGLFFEPALTLTLAELDLPIANSRKG
jgi:glutamyl/glutaminyl-tRNA synthetase